ncbi:MAG: EF-P lysine aminoacylase EpmA [Candidatus Magasanikbacteria bacterium]
MNQVVHIANKKDFLKMRFLITQYIREFFWSEGFLEVETPSILKTSGQEPNIQAMKVVAHNERHESFQGYLATYPEYTMKKMIVAGFDKIFTICKAFRDHESFGGTHNPEFTIIEWYRNGKDFFALMDDMEHMFHFIARRLEEQGYPVPANLKQSWKRSPIPGLWKQYAEVNLDNYLDKDSMYQLCVEKGYKPEAGESYEELFYRIFLNHIEKHLGNDGPEIIYHYPALMASLSKRSTRAPGYAERFEAYYNNIEIANGFTELTDADEQLKRLEADKTERARLKLDDYEIDNEFIDAVHQLPECTGNSMGIDRIVQVFTGCKNIDNVIALPMSRIFNS